MPLVPFRQLSMGLVKGAQSLGQGLVNGATNAINQAGEISYDMGRKEHDLLDPALIRMGLKSPPPTSVDLYAQKGYPAYMRDGPPGDRDWQRKGIARTYLTDYDPRTLPQQLPPIHVYRADPTGKYGGKDGLETLPTKFGDNRMEINSKGDPIETYAYARALGRAQHYGVPQLSAQQLAALVIKEGRADFGHNMPDIRSQKTEALIKRMAGGEDAWSQKVLDGRGQELNPLEFAATVAEKAEIAKRLNIPFAEAWNGTGNSGAYGNYTTGAQYAKGYEYALKAAAHPKNKPLVDLIQSALDAGARDR